MADTGHKTVVVTGDVTMDWSLARLASDDDTRFRWDPSDVAQVSVWRGGAAMLADVIRAICTLPGALDQLACSVTALGPETRLPLPGGEAYKRYHHSYALWTPHRKEADERKDTPWVWRVKQYLGLDRAQEGSERPRVGSGDGSDDADLIVLDDANLGFRDDRSLWPKSIREGTHTGWTIAKMAAPVAEGPLWEKLLEDCAERMVAVTTVGDLRRQAVHISRGLSWERTAQDLFWELTNNPGVNSLSSCAHTVVSLGPAGALLLSRNDDSSAACDQAWRCRLIFDRMVIEGGWESDYPGGMIGYTVSLTAGIVAQLLRDPNDLEPGVRSGIATMRALHSEGLGEQKLGGKDGAQPELTPPQFPAEMIAHTAVTPCDDLDVADVQNPVRFLTPSGARTSEPRRPAYWTILDGVCASEQHRATDILPGEFDSPLAETAAEVALWGAEDRLSGVPICRIGGLTTVDRREAEGFRRVQGLIEQYCRGPSSKPLAIAVFGPPGSGKSFGVKQVVKSVKKLLGDEEDDDPLECNLSQCAEPHDLVAALHRVRDIGLSGQIPLVFWDEFDSDGLAWLKHFLAPIQDGKFRDGANEHHVGRAIFVFAGGTSASMAEFDRSEAPDEIVRADFVRMKGPDFVSRLKGYVDIMGPNPQGEDDRHYLLRRAILLRSILERTAPTVVRPEERGEKLHIDAGVLRAFLHVSEYKHGVRSIESIIAMSSLVGKDDFERSYLPDVSQLDLHADGDEFMAIVQLPDFDLKGPTDPERHRQLLEVLAAAVHENYRGSMADYGDKPKWASADYGVLPEDLKEQNRDFVRHIAPKLAAIGYQMVPARSDEPPFGFPGEHRDFLAEVEHERWLRLKLNQQYRYGLKRDDDQRINPNMISWGALSVEERRRRYGDDADRVASGPMTNQQKQWDRDLIAGIPEVLRHAGYTLVHVRQIEADGAPRRGIGPQIRIGVTGHRFLAEVGKLERGVDRALDIVTRLFGAKQLLVISPLAEGTDRLVARAVLERDGELIAPMPLAEKDYLTDLETEESRQEFRALLAEAVEVIDPPETETRNEAYQRVGQYVLDQADVLIAIWDGQPAQGKGGTAEVVEKALARRMPVLHIKAGNRRPGTNEPTSLGDEQGEIVAHNI